MRKSVARSQFYFYYLVFLYFIFALISTLLFGHCRPGLTSMLDAIVTTHLQLVSQDAEPPLESPQCYWIEVAFKAVLIITIRLFILTIILTQFIGMVQQVRVSRLVSSAKQKAEKDREEEVHLEWQRRNYVDSCWQFQRLIAICIWYPWINAEVMA